MTHVCHLDVRHEMKTLGSLLMIIGFSAFGATMIPHQDQCSAVFTGQVQTITLVASSTNLVGLNTFLMAITDLYKANVKVDVVHKTSQPMNNVVNVYYEYSRSQVCPKPVRLATYNRNTFYCINRDVAGSTNGLFIPMESYVRPAYELLPNKAVDRTDTATVMTRSTP